MGAIVAQQSTAASSCSHATNGSAHRQALVTGHLCLARITSPPKRVYCSGHDLPDSELGPEGAFAASVFDSHDEPTRAPQDAEASEDLHATEATPSEFV